ncbi:ABC transporter permease [Clostridium merdae]|uniref:ABC transporter permease n=1 Tax=Clostridium merdae TaxID=1958780 RepID=UPI000A26F6AE|nr:ABC transporter permease [Clostridium merdae]
MTLKTSSNNLRGELTHTFLWELRHRFGLIALFCGLHFVTMPLVEILAMNNAQRTNMDSGYIIDMGSRFMNVLKVVLPLCTVSLSLLAALLISVLSFQYMHQKRSVDLYHSLPVNRTAMLGGRILCGLVVLFIPLVVNFALTLLIGAVYKIALAEYLGFFVSSLGWIFLMSCASFLFCTFMAVCSGTTFDMVISIVVVNVTYPLMIILGRLTASMIIPGLNNDIDFQSVFYSALSPFVASYLPLVYGSISEEGFSSVAFLAWWSIITVVMILASLYLYRIRKSECAESNYAFPIPKTLIRFVATTAAGLAGALIFHATFNSFPSFFIGLLVASVIAHIIAEAVYGRGFKGLKKSFAYYAVFLVGFAAFYGICATGGFGYDTKLPKAENIDHVQVKLQYSSNVRYDSNGFSVMDEKGHKQIAWIPQTIKEPDNVTKVVALHSLIINQTRDSGYPYRLMDYKSSDVEFTYQMKDGTELKRTFSTDMISNHNKQFDEAMKNVSDLKEYKQSGNAFYYLTPEMVESIQIMDKEDGEHVLVPDKAKLQELIDAIQLDVGNNPEWGSGNYNEQLWIDFRSRAFLPQPGSELQKRIGAYNGKVQLSIPGFSVNKDTPHVKAVIDKYGWAKVTSTPSSNSDSTPATTVSSKYTNHILSDSTIVFQTAR